MPIMNTLEPDEIEAIIHHRRKYDDTPEAAQRTVQAIDARIAWLAARGLRPPPTVIERRAIYVRKSGTDIRRVRHP